MNSGLQANVPNIGAQIWIEPGQTQQEIEGWFRTLANLRMSITRLFIMWDAIEMERDKWDFTLYDRAFNAAEKYGIRVVATLSPTHAPIFRGGKPATQYDEMTEFWEELEFAIRRNPKIVADNACFVC